MKRYVKNAEVSQVFIPGVGKVTEGQVLMGSEYSKFAPRFLTEVPELPAQMPLESTEPRRGPSLLTEPAPNLVATLPAPPEPQLEEELSAETTETVEAKRPRGRPRKNG